MMQTFVTFAFLIIFSDFPEVHTFLAQCPEDSGCVFPFQLNASSVQTLSKLGDHDVYEEAERRMFEFQECLEALGEACRYSRITEYQAEIARHFLSEDGKAAIAKFSNNSCVLDNTKQVELMDKAHDLEQVIRADMGNHNCRLVSSMELCVKSAGDICGKDFKDFIVKFYSGYFEAIKAEKSCQASPDFHEVDDWS